MNREQEKRLTEFIKTGKTHKDFTFYVRHKLTGVLSAIPGSIVSGFLCKDTYDLYEENPEADAVVEDAPVAIPVRKKK